MNTSDRNKKYRIQILVTAALSLALLLVVSGCLSGYGRLKMNREVQQTFEHYQVLDGYRYYYSGRENKPSAVIAIGPGYRFESKYWTEIDSPQTDLKTFIRRLSFPPDSPPRGYDILDPEGRKAGVWFSKYTTTAIRLEDGNRIIVVTPEPIDIRGWAPARS